MQFDSYVTIEIKVGFDLEKASYKKRVNSSILWIIKPDQENK